MKLLTSICTLFALLLNACATGNQQGSNFGAFGAPAYASYSCAQLSSERLRLENQATVLQQNISSTQRAIQASQASFRPAPGLITPNNAGLQFQLGSYQGQLARNRNEMVLVTQAQARNGCGPNQSQFAWDQFYTDSGYQWRCRNVRTGEFALDSQCWGLPRVDSRWPGP